MARLPIDLLKAEYDRLKNPQHIEEQLATEAINEMDWNQISEQSPRIGIDNDATGVDNIEDSQQMVQDYANAPDAPPVYANQPEAIQQGAIQQDADEQDDNQSNDAAPPVVGNQPPPAQKDSAASQLEKLMDEYRAAQKTYGDDIKTASEKDRRSEMIQGMIHGFGKALTYGQFAGAKHGSGPIPLDFKTINPKYAEEAKLVGQSKLNTMKEMMEAMTRARAMGLRQQVVDMGDRKVLYTFGPEGFETQELGKKVATDLQKAKEGRLEKGQKLKEETLGLSKEKFDHAKAQKDEPSGKEVESITGFDMALDDIDRLEGMKDIWGSGPVTGRIAAAKARFALPSEQAVVVAQLAKILSSYGKQISGAAIAADEFKRLENQLSKMGDDPEQFADKLANFKESMENARVRTLDNLTKGGKNVDALMRRAPVSELRQQQGYDLPEEDQRNIAEFMKLNTDVSRQEAIQALREAGKL